LQLSIILYTRRQFAAHKVNVPGKLKLLHCRIDLARSPDQGADEAHRYHHATIGKDLFQLWALDYQALRRPSLSPNSAM